MKALIRDNDIIIEPFSKWIRDHIEWMITAQPDGDGYKLVEDYRSTEISEEL